MIWDFEDIGDWWIWVDLDGIVLIVVVLIIVGMGLEVGWVGVVINEVIYIKKVIFYLKMLLEIVICDLELMVGMLCMIVIGIGMDVLVYCLEVYFVLMYYLMFEGIVLEGMWLVLENLLKVVVDGFDLEVCGYLMSVVVMGVVVF